MEHAFKHQLNFIKCRSEFSSMHDLVLVGAKLIEYRDKHIDDLRLFVKSITEGNDPQNEDCAEMVIGTTLSLPELVQLTINLTNNTDFHRVWQTMNYQHIYCSLNN